MARRRPLREKPVDICRVRPERLRALSRPQLERVWHGLIRRRCGPLDRRSPCAPHLGLITGFVDALLWTRLPPNQGSPRLRKRFERKATRLEEKIRTIQRGCGIK
jgi:hypothetical protein